MTFDPIRIPTDDASSPVPIPKSQRAEGASLYWRANDELSRFEKGESSIEDLTRLRLSKGENISLLEFVRRINESISQFEKTRNALKLMDLLMNKRMHGKLAQSAILLRRYRSRLQSHLARWQELENGIEELQKRINGRIYNLAADRESDEGEVAAYNDAVENYNDKESDGYGDSELFLKAYERYQMYRGSASPMAGREGEIASMNALIEEYNQKAEELNGIIERLNGERSDLGIEKLSLLEELSPLSPLPEAEPPPFPLPGALLPLKLSEEPLPRPLPEREKPDPLQFMHLYYEPVESASIGFVNSLNSLFSTSMEYGAYEKMMQRGLSPIFLNILMVKFAKIGLGGSGGINNKESLLQAISPHTLEKLFSGEMLRTGTIEARIQFSVQEVEEMQLMMMNLLAKISIQAATGPAFEALGSDIGHIGVGDREMSLALSLGFMERVASAIESGAVKENVELLVANSPKLGNFPAADRALIVKKLTATINLMLLENALLHAAVALERPGLIAKVLGLALENSGIKKTIGQETVNDSLRNRGNSIFLQAVMSDKLMESGFDKATASLIVKNAMEGAIENLPFRNGAKMASHLAAELYQSGVYPLATARSIAEESIALLLELSPRAQYEDLLLNAQLTLSLIPEKLLTTEQAKGMILAGYDRTIFDPLYERAIDLLYKVNSPERLVSDLMKGRGRIAVGEEPSPRSVRDMMIQLYRRLMRQGASVEDSLGIAEATFRYIFRSKGAQGAFDTAPNILKLQIDSFHNALGAAGLSASSLEGLVASLTLASLSSPQEAGNIGLASQVTGGVSAHLASLSSLLGAAAADILGGGAGSAAYSVGESAIRSPGALESGGALSAAVRRALTAAGYGDGASALAEAILNRPAKSERLRYLSSAVGGYGAGTTASLLLDPEVNRRLLQERLGESHLSPPLAAGFAALLLPYLPNLDLLQGNFGESLTASVAALLPTSRERAGEIVGSLKGGGYFDGSAIENRLAELFQASGEAGDLTEALARASVVTKNAEQVQGSLNAMVYFQNALLTNLAVGWGVEKNEGSDLIRSIGSEDPVKRNLLEKDLARAFAAAGEEPGKAGRAAEEIAKKSFPTQSEGAEARALTHAIKEALTSTLRIDDDRAAALAGKIEAQGLFDSDRLKGMTADLLSSIGKMGQEEGVKSAEEIAARLISNPAAFESARDFQKAFQDAATITAISPETAKLVSESLRIDHIMHPELLKNAAIKELTNAGYSEVEAEKLASQAAKNLFEIGSSEIDLHMTSERLKRGGAAGGVAIDQLVHSLLAAGDLVLYIEGRGLKSRDLEGAVALSVEKSIAHRQSAASEEVFRNILRDELAANIAGLSSRSAEAIAKEAVITEGLRKELFVEELLRRAGEKVEGAKKHSAEFRITADEVFRTIHAFSDRAAFDSALKGALKKRSFISNIAADEIASSMHAGIVLEGIDSLFTTNSAQLMPQIELREKLSAIITETFSGAIAADKAKRISEEFIAILLGPLATAKGKVSQESILQLVQEQLQELILRVDSKNYRKLIVQGVADTMTSYAELDFDTFLYTETLNASGMQFLKIIQKALLNNIGAEERGTDKTIDLLI